jgi:hypothetical protein
MPEAEIQEKVSNQERQQSDAQRRDRDANAIAEVVGRNPVKRQQCDSCSHNSHAPQHRY